MYRTQSRMSKHYATQVILPDDWEEFSRSPRQYRHRVSGSGILTISLLPAVWPPSDNPDLLIDHLHEMLGQVDQDVGQEQYQGVSEGEIGLLAHSLRRSEAHGVLCFWLLITPVETMIQGSFVMGDLDTVSVDLQDAQDIMQGLYLTETVIR